MESLVRVEYPQPVVPSSGDAIVAAAGIAVIVDEESYNDAAELLRQCKTGIGVVNTEEEKIVPPLHQAHKAAKALFNKLRAPFEQAETILKGKLLDYSREQQRVAAEKQREADAAATAERKRLEQEAAAALESGDVARAEVLASTAEVVQAAHVATAVPKIAGISTRKVWKVEVENLITFLQEAITNPMLRECIDIDVVALAKLAAATNGTVSLPGCKVRQEEGLAARKAA
jgi:hypothetical protein